METDRELLESVFDDADLRYILLYMYLVRFNVFKNLEDDEITNAFDQIFDPDFKDQINVKNLKMLLPEETLKEMFNYHIIQNVKDYDSFLQKDDEYRIKLIDVYIDEPREHILFSEDSLLQIIKPFFPSMTEKKIKDALIKLRATMCQVTTKTHPLVHKYNNDYALDDDLYQIIFLLGNPYLALRLELLIVAMEQKIKESEEKIDKFLKVFYYEFLKTSFLQKIEKAVKWAEENKKGYQLLEYIVSKSKGLPKKFEPPELIKNDELYQKWTDILNNLLLFKYQIQRSYEAIEDIKKNYMSSKQKMSYLKFIEEVTNNEDMLSKKISDSLTKIRNNLKVANETINKLSYKEIKLLDLDVEKLVIMNTDEDDLE